MRWNKSYLTYQLPYTFNYMIKFCAWLSSSCEVRFEHVLEKEDTKTPDRNTFYWPVFLKSSSPTVNNRGIQNGNIRRCSVLCTECPKLGGYVINHVITSWKLWQTWSSIKFRKNRFFSVTECAAVKNKRPHTFDFNRFLTKILYWSKFSHVTYLSINEEIVCFESIVVNFWVSLQNVHLNAGRVYKKTVNLMYVCPCIVV